MENRLVNYAGSSSFFQNMMNFTHKWFFDPLFKKFRILLIVSMFTQRSANASHFNLATRLEMSKI